MASSKASCAAGSWKEHQCQTTHDPEIAGKLSSGLHVPFPYKVLLADVGVLLPTFSECCCRSVVAGAGSVRAPGSGCVFPSTACRPRGNLAIAYRMKLLLYST